MGGGLKALSLSLSPCLSLCNRFMQLRKRTIEIRKRGEKEMVEEEEENKKKKEEEVEEEEKKLK